MSKRAILKTMILAATLGCLGISARAQSTAPPPDAPTPNGPAPGSPPDKDASKTPPDAPAPKKTDKKPSTADDNPFPEDVSKKAAADAKANATTGAPSTAKAHANEPTGSSSLDGLDKLGLDDPTRKELKVASPDNSLDVYNPKRATEDVRVGKYYLQTGDLKGAYDRFKDATGYDHENVEAVFWLAEAARKLHHSDEAVQNYELYLDAVPDGPNAKAARKAMNELASSSKP